VVRIPNYAGVIVDVKTTAVNKPYHYAIPPHLNHVQLGHRVLVPFGNRRVEGYVVEFASAVDLPPAKIKPIISILDKEPLLSLEQLTVAQWMVETYAGLYSQALQCFLPPGTRYGKERVRVKTQLVAELLDPDHLSEHFEQLASNAVKQRAVLMSLKANPKQLASELCKQTDTSYQTLKTLADKGIICLKPQQVERTLTFDSNHAPQPQLTIDQSNALNVIITQFHGERKPVLIHGVTGSGKTEVYLRAIAHCLQQGKQAIMMVPEIALTEQTISRFAQRFPNQIAVLHSGLSEGERYDQWQKIHRGEVPIVIGARSAVFAPLPQIGLIIIDEEHETTYKQTDGLLKYHARSVAIKRASLHNALVVLGSATPDLESYHHALRGDYVLVEMPQRINQRPLPQISLVDMRAEFAAGNRSMFSHTLSEKLTTTLAQKEQAIILLNRRGYAAFVLCRACGHVMGCPNCHVSLTYHEVDHSLKCHYCGYSVKLPPTCPKCGSHYLRQFGTGTQQVEEYVQKHFPQAVTVRLDADTTRRKGAHQRLLTLFREGKANVLIGTQMIAKGLDFPNVTLVGVISADFSLNFPDFRAAERTFQLLTQVSGRAGRGTKPGHVIIQCYDTDHYAIRAAAKHDYLAFYRQEISFRRQLQYPPHGHLVRVLIQGHEQVVEQEAAIVTELIRKRLPSVEIFGPAPAPIAKIKGRYRWHIIVKSEYPISHLLADLPRNDQQVIISVDPDPLFLL